jgi:UDP:flavonoid glycosyltransferase YjiC (YdhE family)
LQPSLRIYLGAFGDPGHAFPMLALGARLAARGHRVVYETWSRWREHVEATGMEFVSAPEYPVFPTRSRPLKPYEAVVLATPVARDQVAHHRPHLVVHDILTLAPSLAAELEGVPTATLVPHVNPVPSPGLPPYALGARMPRTGAGAQLWRALGRPIERGLRQGQAELNEARRQLGLRPVDRYHGGLSSRLTMFATFPQLEYPRAWPSEAHVIGPLLWEPPFGDGRLPEGDGPIVLIAPSTAQDPELRLLRCALEGLAGEPVRVLASLNSKELPPGFRPPANATVVDWVSYSQTMPHADLVICHAGHGTIVRALASGTPVLAVPHSGDMGENAARVEWAGAGMRLPWRLLTPATLRLAVRRALGEERLRARARELAGWAADNDGPGLAAELVERLAVSRSVAV